MKRTSPAIEIVGAREHNLKGVSCRVPIGALTVVTGPSGSGKSSLAFDTLYAEGQRRFVESMSTYARQFLERMDRPDVERIDHILPGIAIAQGAATRSARSTVGTATEIDDVLRLLFASIGVRACASCGGRVVRHTPETARDALFAAWGEGARVVVVAPRSPSDPLRSVAAWLRAGWFRALDAKGEIVELAAGTEPPRAADGSVRLVVGRHVLRDEDPELTTTLAAAFELGDGALVALASDRGEERTFRRGLSCESCGLVPREPSPALFSFNSPRGACETCQGFGRIAGLDREKVIPDEGKTIAERAIAPFNSPSYESAYDDLRRAAKKYGVRRDVPWRELTERERDVVWNGEGRWYGVKGLFEYLEKKRYKVHVRVMIARYRGFTTCPACQGARLKPEALAVTIRGRNIAAIAKLPLDALLHFLETTPWTEGELSRAEHLIADLSKRVATLVEIGLPYLSLSRTVRTLSGGEAQRTQLGSAIGSSLTGTLYVLDEPTVGLHPRDTGRLLTVLSRLAAAGNAVVAVEHDLDVVRAAGHVIDLGPAAGARGGELVFEGTPRELLSAEGATARSLREDDAARDAVPASRAAEVVALFDAKRAKTAERLRIVGARAHNLKNLTVEIPLRRLVAVLGVSGSGKSSLVLDVLAAGAERRFGKRQVTAPDGVGEHDRIEGLEALTDVAVVDQSPLGRSARSNPATYTKAWEDIRALFARTVAAKERGLKAGSFSFNSAGGRCEACEGSGVVTIDMQFLADVTVVCDTCEGKRFRPEVLDVRLRGRNVSELLAATVDEAALLFEDVPTVVRKLAPLRAAGLGYLTLGQSTSTLSGGEAQRLKIASYLGKGGAESPMLFVFDEPTTGLHPSDVTVLVGVLRKLVAAGHSVVVVEHHLGFLRQADHLVELGPEGGDAGGRVVFEGTLESLLQSGRTATAEALRKGASVPTTLQF